MKGMQLLLLITLLSACVSQKREGSRGFEKESSLPTVKKDPKQKGLQLAEVPKVIYTFWDKGEDKMPPLYKDFVGHMRNQMGEKGWQVKVVSLEPGDPNYLFNLLDSYDLPNELNSLDKMKVAMDSGKLTNVVISDLARLAVLNKFGGVHLDPSVVMTNGFENWIERFNASDAEISGFSMGHYADGNKFGKADGMENWGFAVKQDSDAAEAWYKSFSDFLVTDKLNGRQSSNSKIFADKEVKKSIAKLGHLKDYLSQHAALKHALVTDKTGELWKKFKIEDVYVSENGGKNPFSLLVDSGWDEKRLIEKVMNPTEGDLNAYRNAPFLKFNSGQTGIMRREIFLGEGDAYDERTLFGQLMRDSEPPSKRPASKAQANIDVDPAQPSLVQQRGQESLLKKRSAFDYVRSKKYAAPIAAGAAVAVAAGAIGAAILIHYKSKATHSEENQ